jgi:hypothetical protein
MREWQSVGAKKWMGNADDFFGGCFSDNIFNKKAIDMQYAI